MDDPVAEGLMHLPTFKSDPVEMMWNFREWDINEQSSGVRDETEIGEVFVDDIATLIRASTVFSRELEQHPRLQWFLNFQVQELASDSDKYKLNITL
ncbi:hypothetical protein TNCV_1144441 [Trichonephila clavipes]|nr:hypothetical protein TNCV_1144441 [Trichonephila clavipes]